MTDFETTAKKELFNACRALTKEDVHRVTNATEWYRGAYRSCSKGEIFDECFRRGYKVDIAQQRTRIYVLHNRLLDASMRKIQGLYK